MNIFNKVFFVFLVTLISGCATTKKGGELESFDGFWIGEFTIAAENTLPTTIGEKFKLGILIINGKPSIQYGTGNELTAINDREFILDEKEGSMVIYSISQGKDHDGRWVETWVISTNDQNDGTLKASWVRQVNNLNLPKTHEDKQFSTIAFGTLSAVTGVKIN